MRFRPTCSRTPGADRALAGFTLAEVLAALVFMAIVIPVAVGALRVAGRAGAVAERKAEAARVAERLLNEAIATDQVEQSTLGVAREGTREYQWRLRNEPWEKDALRLLTMEVSFTVQGADCQVRLSTLWDNTTTNSAAAASPTTTP